MSGPGDEIPLHVPLTPHRRAPSKKVDQMLQMVRMDNLGTIGRGPSGVSKKSFDFYDVEQSRSKTWEVGRKLHSGGRLQL